MNLRDSEITKTRKRHRCVWCGMHIEIGQSAHSSAWIWEGEFQTGYFHPECWSALNRSDYTEDGWTEGEQPRGVAVDKYGDPIPDRSIPELAQA